MSKWAFNFNFSRTEFSFELGINWIYIALGTALAFVLWKLWS